jgi:hypothetical protein
MLFCFSYVAASDFRLCWLTTCFNCLSLNNFYACACLMVWLVCGLWLSRMFLLGQKFVAWSSAIMVIHCRWQTTMQQKIASQPDWNTKEETSGQKNFIYKVDNIYSYPITPYSFLPSNTDNKGKTCFSWNVVIAAISCLTCQSDFITFTTVILLHIFFSTFEDFLPLLVVLCSFLKCDMF